MGGFTVGSNITEYSSHLKKYPPLSREEEHELAVKYYEDGCADAARKLCLHNLRFTFSVANKYSSRYKVDLIDLIQEANIGLMTAITKFDPTKGTRLITYAVKWIEVSMQNYIVKNLTMISRNVHARRKELFGKGKHNEIKKDFSFSAGAEGMDTTMAKENTEADYIKYDSYCYTVKEINKVIIELSDRDKYIVENRLMKDKQDRLTHKEIAKDFGVSRERIRQVEGRLIKTLKSRLVHLVNF